ncbi:GGDEF domain-containing protein [Dickeya fangzhongdai]
MLICEKNYAKRFAINIIKRKVYTDYLSGLYNRKFLWKKVQEIPKEATLSVLICDIDNFKHINDTYGHGNGDKIIQAVSHTIKTHISHHDLAVRWGGEEFLILSRSPDKPYLNTLSTRILDSIRELQITLDGDIARHVTVSIGGCTFEYRQSPDFVMAIETADKLLYQSKQAGKDRATLRILAQDTNESESYLPVLPSAEHEKL